MHVGDLDKGNVMYHCHGEEHAAPVCCFSTLFVFLFTKRKHYDMMVINLIHKIKLLIKFHRLSS
jgi:hypothetical protein